MTDNKLAAANQITSAEVVGIAKDMAELLSLKREKEKLFAGLVDSLEHHAGPCELCRVRAEYGRKLIEAEGAMLRG